MSSLSSLEVQITHDHINKLLNIAPIRALSELIWNSLVADATEIQIELERNVLGGIEEVWLKEWSEVIQEAKGKHQFLKERLELEVRDNEEGLNYLRAKYSQYLPN